jgi:hypothetical protein
MSLVSNILPAPMEITFDDGGFGMLISRSNQTNVQPQATFESVGLPCISYANLMPTSAAYIGIANVEQAASRCALQNGATIHDLKSWGMYDFRSS